MTRDTHLVIPTIDRRRCEPVIQDALLREPRLAKLTVVAQDEEEVPTSAGRISADLGVVYREIHLPQRVGAARARLLGSRDTAEPFIAFQDDDITFQRGCLSDLVSLCLEEGLGGAAAVIEESRQLHHLHLSVKAVFFRGIFADPRAAIYRSAEAVEQSPLLPLGATVYRRDVFERCAAVLDQYALDYSWGEDVEVSFCASQSSRLAIDPGVRVTNGRHYQGWNVSPTERAVARLQRYTRFADAHVRSRRDRLHFVLVVIAVFGQAVAERASPSTSFRLLARMFHRPVAYLTPFSSAHGGPPESPPQDRIDG